MSDKSRLLVVGQDDAGFHKFVESITPVLQTDKYSIESVKCADLTKDSLGNHCGALFLLDNCGQLDAAAKELVTNFVFGPASNGKAMLFCNLDAGDEQLWLLHHGFKENKSIPDVIELFRKFVKREDIPVNRQAVQLTGAQSDDDFTVALARVENAVEYLCASAESGSQVVFAATTADKAFAQPSAVWFDLARSLNLDTVDVSHQPQMQSMAASTETVLIYAGEHEADEHFAKFDAAVKLLLKPDSLKYARLSPAKLRSDDVNLSKICKVVLLAADAEEKLDEKSRKNLYHFFTNGGKLMFISEASDDANMKWFLKSVLKNDDNLLALVQTSFAKFVKGERIPTDMQAMQLPKSENEYSIAFLNVENVVPLLYISCENGSTAAFVAAAPEELVEQSSFVWKELLRVVDVIVVPGQDHRFNFGRMISRIEDESIKNQPPNLFLFNGNRQDQKEFNNFSNVFRNVLRRDSYVVYPLPAEALRTTPKWIDHARALFIVTDNSSEHDSDFRKSALSYFDNGGKLMFFIDLKSDPSAMWFLESVLAKTNDVQFNKSILDGFQRFVTTGLTPTNLMGRQVKNEAEIYLAMMKVENTVSVLFISFENGSTAVFVAATPSEILKQNEEVWKDILRVMDLDVAVTPSPPLTSGYLVCKTDEVQKAAYQALKSVEDKEGQDILFVKMSTDVDATAFPLRVHEMHAGFDKNEYFATLSTKSLGQSVVFIPVARSVLPIAVSVKHRAPKLDTVVIAQQQTAGQGGFGKHWISPQGAALFAYVASVAKDSPLGKNITFADRLASVAVVEGIKVLPTYAQLSKVGKIQVGIKWPNDIYIGDSIKIGSVLAKVDDAGSSYFVTFGIGLNVSNKRPTACLNDFVPSNVQHFKVESVIAAVLNQLEHLLQEPIKKSVDLFEKNCVNINKEAVLYKTNEKATVVGVSENGDMKVKLAANNEIVDVTYDDSVSVRLNSLDCLVRSKK